MTTLTVWKVDSEGGARGAVQVLERLQKEELLQVVDAAIVTWPPDRKKPKSRARPRPPGTGAAPARPSSYAAWEERARSVAPSGAYRSDCSSSSHCSEWRSARRRALAGSMTDIGIDDDFVRKVRDEVTPGTSALFVMSANVVADRVLGEFKGTGAHLASSNLSTEQETKLREVFAEDEAQTPAG
jgi:uncharacterized membrane protein